MVGVMEDLMVVFNFLYCFGWFMVVCGDVNLKFFFS